MKRRFCLALTLFCALGCAAGDGDGEESGFGVDIFNGRWSGRSAIVEDSCSDKPDSKSYRTELTIEQDKSSARVKFLLDNGTVVMDGTANSFRLNAHVSVDDTDACAGQAAQKIYLVEMTALEVKKARIVHEQIIRCEDVSFDCSVKFTGDVVRLN